VTQQAQNQFRPVDIIFAIDNSGSMTFEAQEVQDNMNAFATQIVNAGLDVRVVMISIGGPPVAPPFPWESGTNGVCIPPPLGTGLCPFHLDANFIGEDSNPPGYQRVDDEVGSHDALEKFLQHYQSYKPTLRQNAIKFFVVVTDDESDLDAVSFTDSVNALDPGFLDDWRLFGIFCTGTCNNLLACAATGAIYMQLVQQTGGVAGDLCVGQSDFQGVFTTLAEGVNAARRLDCQWEIPDPPPGETFAVNKVNVLYTPGGAGAAQTIYKVEASACGPQGGWYYDDPTNPTYVRVCPATCSTIQNDWDGKIDILFGCATEIL
jgi:hypothetical protein